MDIKDEKIFIYLRLRDEKKTLLKSRIREFAALGKLLADFMKEVWEKFGFQIFKLGSLEYVDANSDLILISFRQDAIRQQTIVSGLIPKIYQPRMLDENETRIKFSADEFVNRMTANLAPSLKASIRRRIQSPSMNMLALIKQNMNENGEFYIVFDSHGEGEFC